MRFQSIANIPMEAVYGSHFIVFHVRLKSFLNDKIFHKIMKKLLLKEYVWCLRDKLCLSVQFHTAISDSSCKYPKVLVFQTNQSSLSIVSSPQGITSPLNCDYICPYLSYSRYFQKFCLFMYKPKCPPFFSPS